MTPPSSPEPPPRARPLLGIPPRLVVALALVTAGAAVLVAVLVTLATVPAETFPFGTELGMFERIRVATQFVDAPLVALIPLAVLLVRVVDPDSGAARSVVRTVLSGASAVGASLAFFVVLRILADLAAESVGPSRIGALAYDVGALAVAVAGAYWAAMELARSSPPDRTASESASAPGASSSPLGPPAFPSGPPPAGPGPPAESPPPPGR